MPCSSDGVPVSHSGHCAVLGQPAPPHPLTPPSPYSALLKALFTVACVRTKASCGIWLEGSTVRT